MRIAFITTEPVIENNFSGRNGFYLHGVTRALAERHNHVELIAPGPLPVISLHNGVVMTQTVARRIDPFSRTSFPGKTVRRIDMALALRRALATRRKFAKFDFVHFTSIGNHLLLSCAGARKIIYLRHAPLAGTRLPRNPILRLALHNAWVYADNRKAAEAVISRMGVLAAVVRDPREIGFPRHAEELEFFMSRCAEERTPLSQLRASMGFY